MFWRDRNRRDGGEEYLGNLQSRSVGMVGVVGVTRGRKEQLIFGDCSNEVKSKEVQIQ